MGENLEFTRNLREIYEKKTSEVDLGVVKDKGGGEQFLKMTGVMIIYVLINYLDHIHVHRQLRPPPPFLLLGFMIYGLPEMPSWVRDIVWSLATSLTSTISR